MIETGTVGRQTVVETVEAPASVVAAATAVVTAPANGSVSRVVVRDGQRVQRGQTLFVVNSPETEQRLAQAQQAAAGATASVDLPQASAGASAAQAAAAAEQAFDQAREAAKQIQDRDLRQQALQQVAARSSDLVARYGGEEFALVLPATHPEQAFELAERVRCAVERIQFIYRGARVPIRLSLGVVAHAPHEGDTVADFIALADAALYRAKGEGRNRSMLASA